MNPIDYVCPTHGPYDASLGACPHCRKNPPPLTGAPQPADEDALQTQFEPSRSARGYPAGSQAEETAPPSRDPLSSEDVTQPPRRRILDSEDMTAPPRRRGRSGSGDALGAGWGDSDEEELESTMLDEDAGQQEMLGWLVIKSPPLRRGKFILIKSGQLWGRDSTKADVWINDKFVTGVHARIRLENDQFVIYDLASENGTFVNGQRITAPTPLVQDDEIRMGETVFVLKTLK